MTTSPAAPSDLLADELRAFEHVLDGALAEQRPHLSDVEHALYRGGKRLRPILLLLSYRATQSPAQRRLPPAPKVVAGAVALEMLHTATLIHDDIADGALTRRGHPTVHAARGVGAAVVVGDMQLVQALRRFAVAVDTAQDMDLVRTVLEAGLRVCRGQLEELAWAAEPADPVALRERCMRVADRKTATLFELACGTGATLASGTVDAVWMLSRFGRQFGRVLQLMDDLGDVVEGAEGAAGSDLLDGRPSLPLLLSLDELGPASAAAAVFAGERDAETIAAACREVVGSRAFLTAYADGRRIALDGLRGLDGLSPSPYREALRALTHELVDCGLTGVGAGEVAA